MILIRYNVLIPYRIFVIPSNREDICNARSPSYGGPSTTTSSVHAALPAGRAGSGTPLSRGFSAAANVKVVNEEGEVGRMVPAVADELPSFVSSLSTLSTM